MAKRGKPPVPARSRNGVGVCCSSRCCSVSRFFPAPPACRCCWPRGSGGARAGGADPAGLMAVVGLLLIAVGDRARVTRRVTGIVLGTLAAIMLLHVRTTAGDLLRTGMAGGRRPASPAARQPGSWRAPLGFLGCGSRSASWPRCSAASLGASRSRTPALVFVPSAGWSLVLIGRCRPGGRRIGAGCLESFAAQDVQRSSGACWP